MNWSEEEVLARGNRFLEDQRAERELRERGVHDAMPLDIAIVILDALVNTTRTVTKSAKVRRPRTHPERDLEQACSQILQYDGWRLLKTDPVSDRLRGKGFGEIGMADCMYIRYWTDYRAGAVEDIESHADLLVEAQVLWIEWKSPGGKPSAAQRAWIAAERARGALVWLAGEDFPASVEGFLTHYRASGLMRRPI